MSLVTDGMNVSASRPKRDKSSKKARDDSPPSPIRSSSKTRATKKSQAKKENDPESNKKKSSSKSHRADKETDAQANDSSSLIVEVGDSPAHPTHSSPESPPDNENESPKERDSRMTTLASATSARPSSNRPVVSRWMAKHRDSVSAAGIFTVMASATEDEVEACYPSVSIVSGALRAGSLIPPSAAVLLKGELETMKQDDSENLEPKPTPQQLRDALLAGAFLGSAEVIDDCLRKGADLTAAESSGRNVLHYIATGGHGSLCKKVISRLEKACAEAEDALIGALNKKDANGWTPLLVAVCRGQLDVVEALLAHPKVDCNLTLAHSCPPSQGADKAESTAIHFAAIQGSAPIVKRLMDRGLQMNAIDSVGRNIFHYVAALKNQTLAGAFFASVASDSRFSPSFLVAKDVHLRDPLYTAVCYGSTDLAVCMIRILSTATTKGQLTLENPWSLSKALLSHDTLSLSCVQVAHLRRNFEVIYKLGEIWPLYRLVENGDPETFVDALLRERPSEPSAANKRPHSPSLMITETLSDPHLWNDWLRADLTNAERIVVDLVKRTLKFMAHQRGHVTPLDARHESQLMRSVRRCGTDLVLKALDATLASELEVSPARRMSELTSFLTALKTTVFKAMNQPEAQSTWKYINAEGTLIGKQLKNTSSSPGIGSPACRFAAPTATALRRLPARQGDSTGPGSACRNRPNHNLARQGSNMTKNRAESISPDSTFRRQGSSPSGVPSFAAPTLSRLAATAKVPKNPVTIPAKKKAPGIPTPVREPQMSMKTDSCLDGLCSSDDTSGFCA